jgi:hypothetical protein
MEVDESGWKWMEWMEGFKVPSKTLFLQSSIHPSTSSSLAALRAIVVGESAECIDESEESEKLLVWPNVFLRSTVDGLSLR